MKEVIPAQRLNTILEVLKETGIARIEDLQSKLAVSSITIRRDLLKLEERGLIERTHGGAIYIHNNQGDVPFENKKIQNVEAKEAIGKYAASLVKEGETVFINNGNTTKYLLKNLSRMRVNVVTNNISAIQDLDSSLLEVVIIGGFFKGKSGCTVGDFSHDIFKQIIPYKTIIGVDSISLANGVTSHVYQEAMVTKTMVESTQGEVIVLADSQKIGKVNPYFISNIDKINTLITDNNINPSVKKEIEAAGIKVIIAM